GRCPPSRRRGVPHGRRTRNPCRSDRQGVRERAARSRSTGRGDLPRGAPRSSGGRYRTTGPRRPTRRRAERLSSPGSSVRLFPESCSFAPWCATSKGFFAVNNVYAVLYKDYDSEGEFRTGAKGPEWTAAGVVYVSRFTVIGIAPLLNSTHAISIGSTTPPGTSMRIGDPMLIWSARAPIMRAFSNRVERMGGPS